MMEVTIDSETKHEGKTQRTFPMAPKPVDMNVRLKIGETDQKFTREVLAYVEQLERQYKAACRTADFYKEAFEETAGKFPKHYTLPTLEEISTLGSFTIGKGE